LVLSLFCAVSALVRRLMRALFRRVVEDLTVENLIKQFTYYAIWGPGILVAVDALGFDPQTVVTGLGLTGLALGFALGFALKDIISNFVSGILILLLRPFRLGDQIIAWACPKRNAASTRVRRRLPCGCRCASPAGRVSTST
jgi:small-conductance mechanosensitive channel